MNTGLYEDLWETVTLYANRTRSANYVRLADGQYQVNLTVEAHKARADAKGRDHPIAIHDWIDIGALDAQGNYLHLQKQKIEKDRTEVTFIVDKEPAQAGIDPLNKLIDRNPEDNLMKVEKK